MKFLEKMYAKGRNQSENVSWWNRESSDQMGTFIVDVLHVGGLT